MSSLASPSQPTQGLSRQFLIFCQGSSVFAVDLLMVREVLNGTDQRISPVANTAPFLLGLMNLRGEVVAVADFGRLINMETVDRHDPHSRVLILETTNPQDLRAQPIHIGLLVSQVEGVLPLYPDLVVSAAEVSEEVAPLLRGLYDCNGRLLMMLDLEAIAQSKAW